MPKCVFAAALVSLFAIAGQGGAQGGLPATHSAKPPEKPKVTPKKPVTLDNVNLQFKSINAAEGSTAQAIRGVMSSPDENPGGEKDAPFAAPTHSAAVAGLRAARADMTSFKVNEVSRDPKAQDYLNAIRSALGGFEIKTALLAGHKYMLADCVGIKVSAGEFSLKVPDPDVRIENTDIVVTFAIPHVEMSAVKFRFRPDVTDVIQPCHFSGRYGIGASADDVRLELHFDPILDAEKCKVGSLGHVATTWRIGHLRMSPLPPDVVDLGAGIVEDALNFGSSFNIVDRIVAGMNGFAGTQCHK
jgi:hypothetical protein